MIDITQNNTTKHIVLTDSILDSYAMACNLIRHGIKFAYEIDRTRHKLIVEIADSKLERFMHLVQHINATIIPVND